MNRTDDLTRETRNVLVDKILKAYTLEAKDIADAVELYYDCQKLRIIHANKERTEGPPHPDESTLTAPEELPLKNWLARYLQIGEQVIAGKLLQWVLSDDSPQVAKWAYDQVGIGPIIASGLAAHIDLTKASNPSSVWKFAGLAPGYDRKIKGQKLPYNSRLKVLCWKLGESFVKVSGKDGATYGKLYAEFKTEEIWRNDSGAYAVAATKELAAKNFKSYNATRKRLEAGKLSDAHLHARAKRRAVKMFLSHYWLKGRDELGLPIPGPYAGDIMGHSGMIEPSRAIKKEKPKPEERAMNSKTTLRFERAN